MRSIVCPIRQEADVYLAIGHSRAFAEALSFTQVDRTRIEIVILELSRNILGHAGTGEIQIAIVQQDGRRGIAIEARDSGPGIPDIELAMRDGYSTARTLGAGLPGVQRLMDEFTIESTVSVGTTVSTIKWERPKRPSISGYRS